MEKQRAEIFQMEMESLSQNEEFARVVAAVFLSRMDPTLEEAADVKTAVSEAVTNAVIHGYGGDVGRIFIKMEAKGQEFSIEIRDQGVGIPDISRAMEPMYTSDKSGERSGMGFSFMEAFMDTVEVESKPGEGSCIRMRKHIGG